MSRVDIVHWLIHQVMAAWVSSGNTASRAVMNVEYIVCGTCSHSSQENISEIQKMCASFPKKLLLFKVSVPFSTMLVSWGPFAPHSHQHLVLSGFTSGFNLPSLLMAACCYSVLLMQSTAQICWLPATSCRPPLPVFSSALVNLYKSLSQIHNFFVLFCDLYWTGTIHWNW